MSQVGGTVDGGGTLLFKAIMVVIPLLLVIASDIETNPGPGGNVCKANNKHGMKLISEYQLGSKIC